MMKSYYIRLLFLLFSFAAVSLIGQTQVQQKKKLTESEKINMLLNYIEHLDNAAFIRNGSEHTAKEAAEHLSSKKEKAGNKIKTAVDFIVHVASKSTITGKPYLIRFADGRIIPSQQLLAEELKRIEKTNI